MRASILDGRFRTAASPLVLMCLYSCWTASSTVGVRLLGEDEEMASSGSDGCEFLGDVGPELSDVIVAYARSHLLGEVDKLSGYVSTRWPIEIGPTIGRISCMDPAHRDAYFATIEVTPRTIAGEVDVSQHQKFDGHCTWGAQIKYCFRISTQQGQRTVLIKKRGWLMN
jgi:hypothetical protein